MKNKWIYIVMAILMTSSLGGVGYFSATVNAASQADMIITNGKIVTVDEQFSIAQAVAVKDGKIIAVGTDQEIKALAGKDAKVIDLNGKTLIPGINDTHIHASLFGGEGEPLMIDINYPKVKSIADIVKKVGERAKTMEPGKWILGMSLNLQALEETRKDPKRLPTRWDLDAVSPDNPVILSVGSFSFLPRINLLNSKAIELLGINKDLRLSPMDEIVKDPKTGEMTGLVKGFMIDWMVKKKLPQFNRADKKIAVLAAVQRMNALGVTSMTDPALGPGATGEYLGLWDAENIDAYNDLYKEGKLTMRVSILALFTPYSGCEIEGIKKGVNSLEKGSDFLGIANKNDNEWLRVAGIKLFSDGNPMMQTAFMYSPYPNGTYGSLMCAGANDDERRKTLRGIITYAHEHNIQVGIHSIGDRGGDEAVEAFIEAEKANPKNLHHYVIHGGMISAKYGKDMVKYNIGVSPQTPMMFGMPMPGGGGMSMSMPTGPMKSPLNALIKAGVHVSNSSDAPCFTEDWKLNVQGVLFMGVGDIKDAIRMYTIQGAWIDKMDKVKGSIEVGKYADFAILDKDILTVDPKEINKINNVMTIVGGKVVYEAN